MKNFACAYLSPLARLLRAQGAASIAKSIHALGMGITLALSLTGCNVDDFFLDSPGGWRFNPDWRYTVGGTVSGLSGTGLVLQNNGSDSLAISANGDFEFDVALASGAAYSVTVLAQPSLPSQTCTVTGAADTVTHGDVTSVTVSCVTNTYTVGGTVSGLTGTGLVLQNNGGDNLAIGADGSFTFATPIVSGADYSISVLGQPSGPSQLCTVTSGAGPVTGANITNVQVDCVNTYTVGGSVSGLSGSGLVLQNNGGDNLAISADGNFTFAGAIVSGGSYAVTVLTQPGSPTQTCKVTNGSAAAINADNTSVQVSCITNTYLFHQSPLSAVDPASPSAPIAIEPTGTSNVTAIEHAKYRPAPFYRLYDRHYRTIMYRKSASGTLWKVNALKSGSLNPAQVSNETAATVALCTTKAEPDYADANNAEFVYRLAGVDNTCNNSDDVWKMVKVGMSATDVPYAALEPLTAVHDSVTGAISGWLALNGSSLNAYDANFANPTLISTFTTKPSVLATAPDGRVVLHIDNQLRVYDPQATPPALSASLGTVAGIQNARRDTTHVYFDDGASLYRLPLDGSAAVSLVQTGTGAVWVIALTDNRLVYWDDNAVTSVPKAGGSPVVIAISASESISPIGTSGTKLYFHGYRYDSSVNDWRSTAHIVEEDGTGDVSIADAAWFSWTEPSSVSFRASVRDVPMDRVLLRNVLTAPFTLSSYIGASGALLVTMGTLPVTMNQDLSPYFMRLPNDGNFLGRTYSTDTSTNDIVFANTEMNNFLVRITSSSGVNENTVGATGCSLNPRSGIDPTLILTMLVVIGGLRWRIKRIP